jgi:hypothetical protein
MATTGYIDLETSQEEAYFGALSSGDCFIVPIIKRKIAPLSFRRRKGVSQKSLLPVCSEAWATLTTEQKAAWSTAGSYCNLNGWRLFVRDYCYRVVNGIEGIATPNNYHQALVGQLQIDAPADELKIIQPHPSTYYISKKVAGTKSHYEPVAVNERLLLPFQIGLSYKSDLVKTQSDGFAKFYAIVRRLYQGNNLSQVLEINLDLQADWKTVTNTLSFILGQYTSYSLYFHLYHLTGTLLVDNIKAVHSSQNWVRDPSCQDIHQDFTRAFYQVPAHWSALIIPDGSFFESVYPL